jgi:hypothetical protein
MKLPTQAQPIFRQNLRIPTTLDLDSGLIPSYICSYSNIHGPCPDGSSAVAHCMPGQICNAGCRTSFQMQQPEANQQAYAYCSNPVVIGPHAALPSS